MLGVCQTLQAQESWEDYYNCDTDDEPQWCGGGGGGGTGGGGGGTGDGGSGPDDPDDPDDPNPEDDDQQNPEAPCLGLTSTTQVFSPANRQRKILGIGEVVTVKFTSGALVGSCIPQSPEWILEKNGTGPEITYENAASCIINAGFKPGTFKIKAKFSSFYGGLPNDRCESCPKEMEMEFTVIEPTGVVYRVLNLPNRTDDDGSVVNCPDNRIHTKNRPSLGLKASVYIEPADVNFYGLKRFKEKAAPTIKLGPYWDGFAGSLPDHEEGEWHTVTDSVVVDWGTEVNGTDEFRFQFVCNSVRSAIYKGQWQWQIPVVYERIVNGVSTEVPFKEKVMQAGTNVGGDENSRFILRKGRTKAENRLKDQDSCPIGPLCD